MAESFDAYHKWLGIRPEEQPPHLYRLIGVSPFESDPDVIDVACDQRMAFLHQCAAGPHSAQSQRLLNEIAAARVCLLDAEKKADYDAALREQLGENGASEAWIAEADGPPPRESAPGPAEPSLPADTPPGAAWRRRWRWRWLFWLSVHAALLYLGWTFLLQPRLSPSANAGRRIAVRPKAERAARPTPRDEQRKSAQAAQAGVTAPAPSPAHAAEAEPKAVESKLRAPSAAQRVRSDAVPPGSGQDLKAATVTMPAAQLPPDVQLPPVQDTTPVTLGTVTQLGERNVELSLESEAADVGDGARLHVERGAGAARWTASVVTGTGRPEHLPLADFLIQDDSLRFQWRTDAGVRAHQLRNCLVHLSTDPERRTMALRGPMTAEPVTLDLSDESSRRVIEIADLPRQDALWLEVTGLESFPEQPTFEDGQRAAQLGRKDLTVSLDPRYGAELQIAFDRYGRDGVAVKVSATFQLGGQQTELTNERLGNLRRQIDELPASRQKLSGLQSRVSSLRGELSRVVSQRPANLPQRAAQTARLAELRGALSRANNSARSLARRVAQLEQFQEGLPALEELAQALDGAARISFRVFAKTGQGELDLVRSGSEPAGE